MTLLDVQSYYDLLKRPTPSTRQESLKTFMGKGLLREADDGCVITNMGALLFAKRLGDF